MLWVSEHGQIVKGQRNCILDKGNLQLGELDFEALLSLLDFSDEDSPDFERFFFYARPHGQDTLKIRNYVGVLRTETGTQIEVLPKISKADNPLACRALLVKMLMELEDSPFLEGAAADLEAHQMPLFEVLLRQFLKHTTEIARKGIARAYQTYRADCLFLRGKLQISEHIRRNAIRSDRMYCEFDEYEIDRPINRLIKGALEIVAKATMDATNQQLCRELLFLFDAVPTTKDIALDFSRIQRDRLIQHYEPAMPSCRMILEKLNPLTMQGHRRASAMLFPMERVFESYVGAKLSQRLGGWKTRAQIGGKALVERHVEGKIFGLRPDFELRLGTRRLIADTKWKLIDQGNRSNNYGISQNDIYQLFAYAQKYLQGQGRKEVILIYPKTDRFRAPLSPFWYRDSDEVLFVLPFDLDEDRLIVHADCSLIRGLHVIAS